MPDMLLFSSSVVSVSEADSALSVLGATKMYQMFFSELRSTVCNFPLFALQFAVSVSVYKFFGLRYSRDERITTAQVALRFAGGACRLV